MNDTDSGVQLELTTALRQEFFKHQKLDKTTRGNPKKYTKTFYKFANAVQKGIKMRIKFKNSLHIHLKIPKNII